MVPMAIKLKIGRDYKAANGETIHCSGWSLSGKFWCRRVPFGPMQAYDESGKFRGDAGWPDIVAEVPKKKPRASVIEEEAFPETKGA